MPSSSILVVDDEQLIRWSLTSRLTEEGYRVSEAATGAEALKRVREGVDLVLLDYRLPDMDGLAVLKEIKEFQPDTLAIMLTAYSSIDTAVEAMRQGAYHYANKPFNLDEIMLLVDKALETTALRREVRSLRANQAQPFSLRRERNRQRSRSEGDPLCQSTRDQTVHEHHLLGAPETLLESELFGHERGAFTGADRQKRGLIETADGGTVFLDEIGEMVPLLQAKLLRFLEEKSFKRVGGATDIKVDVRVIAATNRDLEEEVRKGHFRSDLYYRLNVVPIKLPALRQRPNDIPRLVNFYVDLYNTEFRKRIRQVSPVRPSPACNWRPSTAGVASDASGARSLRRFASNDGAASNQRPTNGLPVSSSDRGDEKTLFLVMIAAGLRTIASGS